MMPFYRGRKSTCQLKLSKRLFSSLFLGHKIGNVFYLHKSTTVLRNFVLFALGVLDFVLTVFKSVNNHGVPANIS